SVQSCRVFPEPLTTCVRRVRPPVRPSWKSSRPRYGAAHRPRSNVSPRTRDVRGRLRLASDGRRTLLSQGRSRRLLYRASSVLESILLGERLPQPASGSGPQPDGQRTDLEFLHRLAARLRLAALRLFGR